MIRQFQIGRNGGGGRLRCRGRHCRSDRRRRSSDDARDAHGLSQDISPSLPLSLSSPIDVPLCRPLYMVVMRISLFSGGALPLSPAHNRREALGRVWLRAEGRGEVR